MSQEAPTGIKSGSWYEFCAVCGRRFFGHTLKPRPKDGLFTCDEDWEEIHPQEFVKAVVEKRNPPHTRPEPTPPSNLNDAFDPSTDNWYGN